VSDPAVAEAAVVGAAKTTGQAVVASVILHEGALDSGDEIILDLRNHVGRRGLAPLTESSLVTATSFWAGKPQFTLRPPTQEQPPH
jgi:acyl-coenzyme A synthetase/AMP-(fatty) acid ligase